MKNCSKKKLIKGEKMLNPNRPIITHIIFPTLCRHFEKNFNITQTQWSVQLKWGKEGINFSCPRDLQPKKYLCELSFITRNNALAGYFEGPSIYWVRDVSEMIHLVYRSYFKYNLLDNIYFHLFRFQINNKLSKNRKKQTLFYQSLLQLSTMDLYYIKSLQM